VKALAYKIADFAVWHCGRGQRTARESLSILMMHGVHNAAMAARVSPPSNSLSLESFAAGVEAIRRRYRIISMDDAAEMLGGRIAWQPHCAVLTFDDSLQCLLPTAARWLGERKLNATFYLSTAVIEKRHPYWWKRLEYAAARAVHPQARLILPDGRTFDLPAAASPSALRAVKNALKTLPGGPVDAAVAAAEQQFGAALTLSSGLDPYANILTWDEVREMQTLGMTLGSHSVSHPNLTLLSPGELRAELEHSRQVIEARTGAPCRHFCYPYGAHAPAVREAARSAGYVTAVTTEAPGWNGAGHDPFQLRRFAMPADPWRVAPLLAGFRRPAFPQAAAMLN